ncbi:CPCC family cysteine-rich protein [Aquimarina macrocephali]|uniref:CPCC family cysteine-rich protein n=1 Tax=Aquimarina macrocephali TaxID=666563 RepID=UPI000462F826|nr:CPCC family cysteine-rich protein [Aquimarina macrocephali]
METKQNRHGNYQCPCCKYYTLNEKPDNTFQTCPVCFWEDDGIQLHDPDYEGGANEMSLNQARRNFKELGVIDLQFEEQVRQPLEEELKD